MGKNIIFILVVFLVVTINANASHYKSYTGWEPDSVLVAWLIKTYVDKDSSFELVAKGEYIDPKFAINTSSGKLRRSSRYTAFEMALITFKISNDKCINTMLPIVRVLEMAPWTKTNELEMIRFESELVLRLGKDRATTNLTEAFSYIDNYCKGKN